MTSRGISNDEIRRRAQLRTDKAEQRKDDAMISLKTQQLRRDTDQAKTLRLRALRLAKEEAAKKATVAAAVAAKNAKKKKVTATAKA
jgi:hypothetical protein